MATYRFHQRIGSGGFGVVYHVTRVEDGLPFAAKRLADEHLNNEEAVSRFRREVRLQRGFDHPNVLPIIGSNLKAEKPWFAMPIANSTLLEAINDGLAEAEIDRVFAGVLAGVAYAHQRHVIHRDIKPENVMMTHDGTPQVSDFGLGKNLLGDTTALTKTQVGIGSFPYVAPEQMMNMRDVDARADVYALGKLLQHMVTGYIPVLTGDPAVPARYRYFIARCTAQDVNRRYQSVPDVIAAFQQVTAGVAAPESSQEAFSRLATEWQGLEEGEDLPKVEELHELLERHAEDWSLFQEAVPFMLPGILRQYASELSDEFRRMVEIYDGYVTGQLRFDYCDVLAGFYERVFDVTDDLEVRRIILSRLLEVGPTHNRWHVGKVVSRILATVQDTSDVMMAVDVLRGTDATYIEWNKSYLSSARLAPGVAEVVFGGGEDDDIPW